MSDANDLGRRYRLWLRLYPSWFRREYETEILALLLAAAPAGRSWPRPMEILNLTVNALRIGLRPRVRRSERSVLAAIKLIYAGALVELAAAITIIVSASDVRAHIRELNPAFTQTDWQSLLVGHIEPTAIAALLAFGVWLWTAWSFGRGSRWVRFVFVAFFGLNLWGLVNGLAHGSAAYARPDLAMGITLCVMELAVIGVLFRVKVPVLHSAGD